MTQREWGRHKKGALDIFVSQAPLKQYQYQLLTTKVGRAEQLSYSNNSSHASRR